MLKKLLLAAGLLYAAATLAAVDVNKASAADLDSVKGIGPGLSEKILTERKSAPFKDWKDFIARVGGVGEKTAARFSAEGLTVNGKPYSAGAAPATSTPPAAAAKTPAASAANAKK